MAVKDQEMNIDRYGDIAASPTHTLDLQATPRYPNCLECYNGKCKIWNHFITSPSPKNAGSSLQFQTALKIHESIRNSASNLYWWSVKDPWHDVFEAGGSTSKKSKLGW